MRLTIFLLNALPLLFGLAHFAGFTFGRSVVLAGLKVFAALAVGFVSVCILLALFGVVRDAASPGVSAAQIALQSSLRPWVRFSREDTRVGTH